MRSKDYKEQGRAMLAGNWGTAIAVLIVTSIILGLGNSFGVRIGPENQVGDIDVSTKLNVIQYILGGAVSVGIAGVYLGFLREGKSEFVRMFDGFSSCFVPALLANIIISVATAVGFVLLVVPGIILGLMFSQTFYILRDHPDMSGIDAIKASMAMMDGHKMELFKLQLSFIPWFLTCVLVIPTLYVIPYFTASITAFYENLKQQNEF